MPWQNKQALLSLKRKACLRVLTPSPALLTGITQNAYKAHEEAPIQTGSRKVLSHPFSLRLQTCLWSSKKKQNTGYIGTFTNLPWVLSQTLAVLPLSQHRFRLMQMFWHSLSPAIGGSLIYQTLSFIRLVFAFTFSVDPYLTDSPGYLTYPPATGRVSAIRLLKQNGSFKSQLAFIATLY